MNHKKKYNQIGDRRSKYPMLNILSIGYFLLIFFITATSINTFAQSESLTTDNQRIQSTSANIYSDVVTTLIDPGANETTKKLYAYLLSQYGKRIISGQTNSSYNDLVKTTTGIRPMLRAYDFQHYTQGYSYKWSNSANGGAGGFSFGVDDNQETEQAIAWYNSTNKKGIVSFQWHWHSPSAGTVGKNTFYTEFTTFSASQAVITTTSQFTQIIQDIDAIAVQLKKLSDADVPVLWRPLHEAGGGGNNSGSQAWFWWGAKGNVVCKKLWDIVYDRMTNYHGLHNLIWVWSSPEASWYPGNDKIDIIGYDSYPGSKNYTIQKAMFDQLYTIVGGNKLITMSENGPIPDIRKSLQSDAPWSYFMSWADLVFAQNSTQHLTDVYNDPYVITLENIDVTVPGISTAISGQEYNDFAVYPNPANDELYIKDKLLAKNIYKIEILNLQGDRLIEKEGYKDFISLEGLQQGFYILNLYTPNQIVRRKVFKL